MSIRIDVKVTTNPGAIQGFREVLTDQNVRLEMNEVVAKAVDPWTPYLTGRLSKSVRPTQSGIKYTVPYAQEKYYGTVYHKEAHPQATDHWVEVALQNGAKEIIQQQIGELIAKKFGGQHG